MAASGTVVKINLAQRMTSILYPEPSRHMAEISVWIRLDALLILFCISLILDRFTTASSILLLPSSDKSDLN